MSLTNHASTHDTEKRFKCDYPGCEYAGKAKYLLKYHQRRHETFMRYACGICDWEGHTKQALNLHIDASNKASATKLIRMRTSMTWPMINSHCWKFISRKKDIE